MAAMRIPGVARVGCSGWSYRDWRGPVYPPDIPERRWFEHYAGRFDTAEINNTFYRLPTVEAVDRWREQAPPGFVYAVKLGQFGSHRRKLRDPASWLPNHLDRVEHLGAALGPTLVQLPPHWHRDADRLDEFLAATPSSQRWAVEVRDPSWLHAEVFDVLHHRGAALCHHDLLTGHPWTLTADFAYVRFHGPNATEHPYGDRYTGRRLWRVAERMESWLADGIDVYAYFNNDQGGAAVADATWLRRRLRQFWVRP